MWHQGASVELLGHAEESMVFWLGILHREGLLAL